MRTTLKYKYRISTDNDPRKSIKFIARDMSNFWVSYQVGRAERHLVFLIQDEKGPIFITDHEGQEEKLCCKVFKQIQVSQTKHDLVFLRWGKFPPGSECELTKQLLVCSVPTNALIMMKTKHPGFGVITSDGDVMPSFIFLYGLRLKTEAHIKCLEEAWLAWIW